MSRPGDGTGDPDSGSGGFSDDDGSLPEPVPPALAAHTRALIEAELRAMQPMSWSATVTVMLASSAVLLLGLAGLSELTPPTLLATAALCGVYALLMRAMDSV